MKRILLGALSMLGLGSVTAVLLLHYGAFSFAADRPHNPAVHRFIEWAREQSIARLASDIVPPADLSNPDRIRRGAGNYDAMCLHCHLAPGASQSEIREGLYPLPPDLSRSTDGADTDRSKARRFWIIKHGIKGSGMPAWSKGGMEDAAIWDLTAFLRVLPSLSPEQYRTQVEASEGHSHDGMEGEGGKPEPMSEQGHHEDSSTHSHTQGAHQH